MKRGSGKDVRECSDLEAGMAKLFASEAGNEVVEDLLPHSRAATATPRRKRSSASTATRRLLLIGEASEIQRMVIGKKLLQRHKI